MDLGILYNIVPQCFSPHSYYKIARLDEHANAFAQLAK
jgi:hypothetical protein